MKVVRRLGLAAGRGLTLGTLFDRLAEIHGDRILVDEAGGEVRTYRNAAESVARWSGGLAVERGDRVVVALPNGYDQLLVCAAVARAGAVPVPLNDKMRPDEVDHVVTDSGAALVVRTIGDLDGGEPLDPVTQPDVAAIFYTSGTTGRPKGARLTSKALLGSLGPGALWPSAVRRDEAVVALPIAHIMGFVVLVGLAVSGVPVHLFPSFAASRVLDAIERRR